MRDTDKDPEVVMSPQAQAKIDADPELAAFIRKFVVDVKNVTLAVREGRCKSFEDGMTALGYQPNRVHPDDEIYDMLDELSEKDE